MALLGAALLLSPALDGESVSGNSTGLGIVSLVSIVLGWLLIAGLWFFVFRDKSRSKRRKPGSPD
jgi:predicted permease